MPVKDRLKKFLKHEGISERRFASLIGVSSSYVSSMSQSLQPDKLQRIIMQFPDLNAGWLMTGEGDMLKSSTQNTQTSISDEVVMSREIFDQISRLTETVLSQQRTIESLTVSSKQSK